MTTARRYGGDDARAAGIVDAVVGEDAVRSTALDLAAAHAGRAGATLGTIEARMYAPALDLLRGWSVPAWTARAARAKQGRRSPS